MTMATLMAKLLHHSRKALRLSVSEHSQPLQPPAIALPWRIVIALGIGVLSSWLS